VYPVPDTPAPICAPPTRLARLLESRAPIEWAALPLNLPLVFSVPKGDGRPVMLIPGFQAGEGSMRPLRDFLCAIGYTAFDWGLGRNRGDVEGDIERVGERTREIVEHCGAPATLVGWSLGGVPAREVARLRPELVREVITLGTPIIGGPKYTSVGAFWAQRQGIDMDAFEQEVHARNSIGIDQPVTSIYSRTDGVVGWQASVDRYNPQAKNVEVSSSHFGLGASGEVWRTIALTLARSAAGAS